MLYYAIYIITSTIILKSTILYCMDIFYMIFFMNIFKSIILYHVIYIIFSIIIFRFIILYYINIFCIIFFITKLYYIIYLAIFKKIIK